MTNLSDKFSSFLKEKGYAKNSILTRTTVTKKDKIIFPDVLIKDVSSKQYLSVIEIFNEKEFKINLAGKRLERLIKILDKGPIPAFVVVKKDNDFEIYVLEEFGLVAISKQRFPTYEDLKKTSELRFISYFRDQNKKDSDAKRKGAYYFFLINTATNFIANFTIFISNFLPEKKISESINTTLIENTQLKKIDSLFNKLEILSHEKKIDTIVYIDNGKTFTGLEKRITIIKNGISNNPEKALAILNIKNELNLLKQDLDNTKKSNDIKNNAIERQIDSTYNLAITTLFVLIGTIFSSVIGLILAFKPDIFKKKDKSKFYVTK